MAKPKPKLRKFKLFFTMPSNFEMVVLAPSRRAVEKWFEHDDFSDTSFVDEHEESFYTVPEGLEMSCVQMQKREREKATMTLNSAGEEV